MRRYRYRYRNYVYSPCTTNLSTSRRPSHVWLALLLLTIYRPLTLTTACPTMCVCIWKGGKQTTECINKSMTDIPSEVDSGTQVIDFSGNNVRNLSAERFQRLGLLHLQKIFLARCRITFVDDTAFRGLANLIELDVSHNFLSAVPSATFVDYPQLMKLSLNGNPIRVVRTAAFRALPYLVSLELNRCELNIIETDAFAGLTNLEWLKLEYNHLKYVPGSNTLPRQLHGVRMQRNPWYCDCLLLDVYRWLNVVNVPDTTEVACDGPRRLRGAPVKSLDENELACRPDVSPTSLYLEIAEGKNLSLSCKVHAVPSAEITWWFKDYLLTDNNNDNINHRLYRHHYYYYFSDDDNNANSTRRSELFVYNTNADDNGTYYCQAENRAGKLRSNYTVRIIVSGGDGQDGRSSFFDEKKIPPEMILALCSMAFLLAALLSVCLICLTVRYRRSSYYGRRKRLLFKKRKTKELALYGDGRREPSSPVRPSDSERNYNNIVLIDDHSQTIATSNVVTDRTTARFTYPNLSLSEPNPDLISDTEKDRSNPQSGDDDDPIVSAGSSNNNNTTLQPPLIVCINHNNIACPRPFGFYYPADYGLPRLPPPTVSAAGSNIITHAYSYRTLPHRRLGCNNNNNNTINHQQSGIRYAREAEFATNQSTVHQLPASYEHYKIVAGNDVRYNVQGYPPPPPNAFNYTSNRGVTFSETVRVVGDIIDADDRYRVIDGNDKDGDIGKISDVSLVNASAQTINNEELDAAVGTNQSTAVFGLSRPESIGKSLATRSRFSRKVPTESPDEGYVGETVD